MTGVEGLQHRAPPLNETCWARDQRPVNVCGFWRSYIKAVTDYVALFRAQGIYSSSRSLNAPVFSWPRLNAHGPPPYHEPLYLGTGCHADIKADPASCLDLYNDHTCNSVPMGGFVAGAAARTPGPLLLSQGGLHITPRPGSTRPGV